MHVVLVAIGPLSLDGGLNKAHTAIMEAMAIVSMINAPLHALSILHRPFSPCFFKVCQH